MIKAMTKRVLYLIACGAGTVRGVGQLIDLAQDQGWDVWLILTPSAVGFLDVPALEAKTGHPIRSAYRNPSDPRDFRPKADAVVVAPATYNTINKWASGASDTYALGILSEVFGYGVPIVVIPSVNQAMTAHFAWQRSVRELRAAGASILFGPGEPHPLGGGHKATLAWELALEEVKRVSHSPDLSQSCQ
jgi:Flavoprotein